MLFMLFQSMFAVLTPALMSGAFVDRMRVVPYMLFIGLWHFLVYCPIAYWNWGGGWMFQMGACARLDAVNESGVACAVKTGDSDSFPRGVQRGFC